MGHYKNTDGLTSGRHGSCLQPCQPSTVRYGWQETSMSIVNPFSVIFDQILASGQALSSLIFSKQVSTEGQCLVYAR